MKRTLLLLAFGLTFSIIVCHGGAFAGGSPCSTAEVDQPFRLPNGVVHPAGTLTLCRQAEHSPVSFLHVMYVNRIPVGTFSSRQDVLEESDSEERYMVFAVESKNVLRLSGIVVPVGNHLEMYRFEGRTKVETEDSIQVVAKDEPEESLPKVAPRPR